MKQFFSRMVTKLDRENLGWVGYWINKIPFILG